jgi:hypothetical protein
METLEQVMNERIKQLELLCYEECGDYHLGSIRQLNVEKFAELLVKECAAVSDKWDDQLPIGDMIKEHFGVEE